MKHLLILSIFCVVSCSPTLPIYDLKISGNAIQAPVSGFEDSFFNILRDQNAPFDILLVKESQLAYHALYLKCPFDEKALDTTPSQIVCPVCASVFDFDGVVKRGPASGPLSTFPTELNPDATLVRINIESLGR